jgi:hypothetical protein
MSFACGKQNYLCVTCMLWCSIPESVSLLVSNIHDIILVHTQHVLSMYQPVDGTIVPVCTGYIPVCTASEVCTGYVQVCTASEPVSTKYPIPVMRFTIPDV